MKHIWEEFMDKEIFGMVTQANVGAAYVCDWITKPDFGGYLDLSIYDDVMKFSNYKEF